MSIVGEMLEFEKMVIGAPKPETINFHRGTEIVGTLYLNELPMRFEGDVDESAQVFWDNLCIKGSSLKNRIAELETENEALRKDQGRLEWLAQFVLYEKDGKVRASDRSNAFSSGWHKDWRDAIDEAMEDV